MKAFLCSQVNQQMAGLSLGGAASAAGFGQPPSTSAGAAGWSGGSSNGCTSTSEIAGLVF